MKLEKPFGVRTCALLSALTLLYLLTTGCTRFHETFYVGMYAPSPTTQPSDASLSSTLKETQLYKYEISGTSFASKTQFASGLYDARVVDRLFGEVRPARSPATQPSNGAGNATSGGGSAATITVDCSAPGGSQYEFDNATFSAQSGAHPTVPLQNITGFVASQATAQFDPGKANVTIVVNGLSQVTINAPTLNGPFPSVSQISGGLTLSGVAAPGATVVADGGRSTIFTSVSTPINRVWQGTFTNALADVNSAPVSWSGSAFASQSTNVSAGSGVLEVSGGITSFSGVSSFAAKQGVTSSLSNSTGYTLTGKCTLTLDSSPQISGKFIIPIAHAMQINVGSKTLDAVASDSTATAATLPGTVVFDSAYNLTAPPPPTSATISAFTAEKLQISTGVLHATLNADAVSPKGTTGPKPAPKPLPTDTRRKIFVKVGPEGEATAQSDSERMVIFMSSDPQALTDRISAMSNAQQMQSAVSAVISQQQTSAAQSAQDHLTTAGSSAAAFLKQVQAAKAGDDVELITKQFIQNLEHTP